MTELERRAMMGDRQAQEECTEKGIALPCCHGNSCVIIHWNIESYDMCRVVSVDGCCFQSMIYFTEKEALDNWNTRSTDLVGRCKDCAHKAKATVNAKGFLICPASGMEISDYDFCSYFQSIPSPEQ